MVGRLVERLLPTLTVRARLLSLSIIILVFAMVANAIVGFAHVTLQQQSLIALRAMSEEMRAVHQSLSRADAEVQRFVLGEGRGDLGSYFNAVEAVKSWRRATLDQLDPVQVGESARSTADIVDSLLALWTQAIDLTATGHADEAQQLLLARDNGPQVRAVGEAVEAMLARANGRVAQHEAGIAVGTFVVLLLQVGSGILAIVALIYAFRSSATDAVGRLAAAASADSSREQVVRLFEMADVLQSATDHGDANAVLRATATELVPGFSGALYIFNNSRDRLVLSTAWGRDEEDMHETINPGACWALKRGKPHLNRADGRKLCCDHHFGSEALLEIPMIARGEIVGLLQLFADGADAEARLESVQELGSALADGMSLALANMALREKLRNQALRDPLTGLYNRRYMEDSLQRFVRLAERENREVSVVMVDLDHFKRLNDEHGHAFGDQVLRDSAHALVSALRETDIVCRYGGEELVVILPDCNIERAADKAELLRQRIEGLRETHKAEISASFGVASIPHTSGGVTDLLAAADAALYKAKQNGRNQVQKAPVRTYRDREPVQPASSAEIVAFEAAE
jgi:diguanylate cyclase (GGDEF)-like protein